MFRWRKPLLVMYDDNYRYGTNLYVPTVNSLDSRNRDYYIPMLPPPSALAPPPRVSLVDYDLYAPISFGYGRSLLKPRSIVPNKGEPTPKSRMSSRYYPFYYGLEGL